MASSSSSSAAAAEPRLPKHDVFLSFRGDDTRNSFTAHLYSALSGKQIKAYLDEVSLEKGDTISSELLDAIEESEISIIIFSKNYASSSWCLDELVHILKCKKEKARLVLPIFIGIDPSHVEKQEGSCADAFRHHDVRFNMEKVLQWRRALEEAAVISGWDSRNTSESEIVQEVVDRVRRELDKSKRSDDLEGLFGISKRLEKIKSFLDSPDVRVVGIWGMGGIGKTTLAKVVFNQFYNDFERSYFAHNVRGNALDTLEKEVYSKLLGDKNLDTSKASAVNRRLSRTKALLVLDDVETPMQLERLAGNRYRFGSGTKIIVTSRHKLVVDAEYEVEVLDFNDACKLFYLNAFGEKRCKSGYKEISDRVVEYTKCHPLAVEVLGASVFCFLESIEDWEKELEKLKRIPHNEIQVLLERSYDALDDEEKGLFLDIACFLKGERRDFVEGILEGKPIAGLVRKSLITIEDDNILMHDLIQEMGRNIVLRSTEKLGERSRLWIAEDVSDVLENNKGTEAIEGIYLPLIEDEVHLRPDVFEEMRKLRLLKFYNFWYGKVKFYDGDLKYLPNSLRYLHWEYYPGKSLPSNFKPQNLVELHMPNSNLEQLWDGVQELRSLKHINLHRSLLLTKFPDLSLAPKLESIDLSSCESLTTLPKVSGNIRKLVLSGTALKELPLSIEHLGLSGFSELESFPMLSGLCYLTKLDLSHCNIREIPDWLGSLTSLTELDLAGNPFGRIPESIGKLHKLKKLDISKCKNLQSLPELPFFIESVNAKYCSSLKMVSTLRPTLTLGRWLDKYDSDNDRREFLFEDCRNLCEDAINNIFREFLYKVFCTATTPPEGSNAQRVIRELVVCYPTKEIPRWFNNQYEGSSITITLPPNLYNAKTFLGFVVSVIFAAVDVYSDPLKCELHLKTNCGESLEEVVFEYAASNGNSSGSDNMVVWYKYFGHSKANFEKYHEASLEFRSPHARVKMCGIRMLYLEDAVEDAVEKSDDGKTHLKEAVEESDDGKTLLKDAVEKSDDSRTPKIEPLITYDSDEPPPKRARNL